jgi:hypothetical protein
MKKETKVFFKFLSIIFILQFKLCFSQIDESVYINELNNQFCGTTEALSNTPYFPVDNDTLRILVIFAKYPDDTWDPSDSGAQATYYWPGNLGSQIPSWATGIINNSTSNISQVSITNYYKEASRGKFWVIGDVYPNLYIFQNNHDYYLPENGRHIGYAVKELLQNLDPYIDYSQYDKFAPNDPENKHHSDGTVDFILIVFRFFLSTEPATGSGVASLGGTNENFGSESYITLDNTII